MRNVRLPLSTIAIGKRTLDAAASRYLIRVLRLRAGDAVEVFDPHGAKEAQATIVEANEHAATIEVTSPIASILAESAIVLVQGYPKGEKLADVVRDATELGATMIVPALTTRSVARPDERKLAGKRERWEAIAAEAARQSRRARAPTITAAMEWRDALATAASVARHRFVAWEEAKLPIGAELIALAEDRPRADEGVAFAIGAEGGLTREEIEEASTQGFAARSMGASILRTETAATAILGAWRVIASSR